MRLQSGKETPSTSSFMQQSTAQWQPARVQGSASRLHQSQPRTLQALHYAETQPVPAQLFLLPLYTCCCLFSPLCTRNGPHTNKEWQKEGQRETHREGEKQEYSIIGSPYLAICNQALVLQRRLDGCVYSRRRAITHGYCYFQFIYIVAGCFSYAPDVFFFSNNWNVAISTVKRQDINVIVNQICLTQFSYTFGGFVATHSHKSTQSSLLKDMGRGVVKSVEHHSSKSSSTSRTSS